MQLELVREGSKAKETGPDVEVSASGILGRLYLRVQHIRALCPN